MTNLTLIQLNARHFKHFDTIAQYLLDKNADIICLQEVADGILSFNQDHTNWLGELSQILGMNAAYAPRYQTINHFWEVIWSVWYAILTKHEISTTKIHRVGWYIDVPQLDEQTALIATGQNLDPVHKDRSYELDQELPNCVLEIELLSTLWTMNIFTTKFPVSHLTQDTDIMVQHAQLLASLVVEKQHAIVAWDFNTLPTAPSISVLQQEMNLISWFSNTLNPHLHSGFQHGIPASWLHVDHILVKGIGMHECHIDEVNVSDHLPVRATFCINK